MRLVLATFLFVSATAAASPAGVSFTVRDAAGFMKDVARSCLSASDSRIERIKEDQLLLTDSSDACAMEIRQFADGWMGSSRPGRTVSVFVKSESQLAVTRKLVDKFGKSILILPSRACPCLLVAGPRAEEATAFARRQ